MGTTSDMLSKGKAQTVMFVFYALVGLFLLTATVLALMSEHWGAAIFTLALSGLWGYRAYRWARADADTAFESERGYRPLGPR